MASLISAAALILLLSGRSSAEFVEVSESWRTAPLFGADVRSLVFDPQDPTTVFAGTSAGQIYRSTDGGDSWSNAAAPLPFPGWVVEELLFDPDRPGRLWVALRGIWGGGQIAVTDDGGRRWVRRGDGLEGRAVYSLARVRGRLEHLYAGTSEGVWKSEDGGDSWRQQTVSVGRIGKVTSLLVDRNRPQTVIAGTWRRAYRSDDGGSTWRGVFDGMVEDSEVFTLTPIGDRQGEIWASTCGWVYRSLDGGGHWQRFKEGFEERRTPSFEALPNGRLLAGTVAGLHISDDGGGHWSRRTGSDLSINVIAFHPDRPRRVLLGTEGSGVWTSTDGGSGFGRSDSGMTNLRVAALAARRGELLVAVNHAGPASGIYRSTDGGRSFDAEPASLPTVLALAIEDDQAWAATEKGLFRRVEGRWSPVAEFGNRRIAGVLGEAGRLVIAAADGVYERWGSGFRRTAYRQGPPRSATVVGQDLWVTDAAGLYRVFGDSSHRIAAPYAPGKIANLGRALLFTGASGAWRQAGLEAAWEKLTSSATRALSTGDERWPILLMTDDSGRLLDAAGDIVKVVDLPIPARDVTAALLDGERLILGTSGYGVMIVSSSADDG